MTVDFTEETTVILKDKLQDILTTILHSDSTHYMTQVRIARDTVEILQLIESKRK